MTRGARMRRGALALAIGLGAASGCGGGDVARGPHRFVDELAGPIERGGFESVAEVAMRTLQPPRPIYRFHVVDPPPHPLLVFSAGVLDEPGRANVRFEVELAAAAGTRETLWSHETSTPGWTAGRVDLGGRRLSGADLVFRATQAPGGASPHGRWGNPMLISGEPQPLPSVVLVSIDTLRADFVGCYGRTAARTPSLDRLAAEGTLYEHAYAPSTWTLPSHAALMLGTYVRATGLGKGRPTELAFDSSGPERPLAVLLAAAGYRTAAFTGGGFVDWRFGFGRGFDRYFAFRSPSGKSCAMDRFDGPTVFARAIEWLREDAGAPFFLFVHTYDVHDRCPFVAAAPWNSWPPSTPKSRLVGYYDDLIAHTDARVGALLDALHALGLAERTLVVVTSDHGEGYSEHGERGHGCNLPPYEELARVPLLVRFPGRVPAGQRVEQPVSLVDLAPTVLALLGLPPAPWMGGTLPGLAPEGARPADAPLFVHCGDALAVRLGSRKLVASGAGEHADELYDLARDPDERAPLADADESRTLRAAGQRFLDGLGAGSEGAAPPVPAELRERLHELGYAE